MKARMLVAIGGLVLALTLTAVAAQAGGDVERVQQALKQAGHDPGPIDGVMGAQTGTALKAYQKEQGLRVTGRLDSETSAKLGQPAEAAPSSAAQSSAAPSSTQTGGDKKPNAVDPAQATKTGANAGEGASYSRSQEKGDSTK